MTEPRAESTLCQHKVMTNFCVLCGQGPLKPIAGREATRPTPMSSRGLLDTTYTKQAEAYMNSLEAQLAAQPSVQRDEDEPSILERLTSAFHALRSYQYGNSSPELAEAVADSLEEYIAGKMWITAERGSKCLHTKTTKIGIASDAMYHCHPVMKCDACGEEIIERGNGER